MAADLLSTIASEIETRLAELRPALAEYEQLLVAADALAQHDRSAPRSASQPSARSTRPAAASRPTAGVRKPRPASRSAKTKPAGRAPRGAAREAILAALGHGSHTVGELVMVTAMSTPNVNGNLRRLVAEGLIAKAQREGKTAYALTSGAD